MIKRLSIYLASLLALTVLIACNEDKNTDLEFVYSSTMVKSFKLQKNQNIINNLDTIFFSIDLENARIFNADSLPYGTPTDKLLVRLSTDACSVIEFHVTGKDGKTSVINYLKSDTDSINFSNGPVKLHLVSFDGKASRDYTVSVNVHKMVPDSLYWDKLSRRNLPSTFSNPTAQKSVKTGDYAVTLSTDGTQYCIAVTDDPAADSWVTSAADFSFTPQIATLAATSEAIYILDTDGNLYRSADKGNSWQPTGAVWTNIFGAWNDRLLGVVEKDGSYFHSFYNHPQASIASRPISADFPVSATSTIAQFSTRWSTTPQITMAGGRKADGSISSSVWGYDGNSWAELSSSLPKGIERSALCAYEVAKTDTMSWKTDYLPALLLFGGKDDNGVINKDVYISRDFGVNWHKGDDNMQLPSYVMTGTDAQPLVFSTKYTSASPLAWREYSPLGLSAGWRPEPNVSAGMRAVKPVTEWEAPFIYLFGGYDADGALYNNVWKGVINILTFHPLY